jgi:hypothetical protein
MLQSDSIAKITLALSKAQAALRAAKRDSANPFFKSKYADLQEVIEAIREPFAANELAFTQFTDFSKEEGPVLVTQISHSSGEWMRGVYPITGKDISDPQKLGAATTYARRFALKAAVGLAEEDDDGNSISHKPPPRQLTTAPAPIKKDEPKAEPITTVSASELIWPFNNKQKGMMLGDFNQVELVEALRWLTSWDKETKQQKELIDAIETLLGMC